MKSIVPGPSKNFNHRVENKKCLNAFLKAQTLHMKLSKLTVLLQLFLVHATYSKSFAQEVTLQEGSFNALHSEKKVSLKFTFDSLQVGKFKKESDYVAKKVSEINKKYPGKGDEWASNWITQRTALFEPAFVRAFIESSSKDTSAPTSYTLIFNTSFIEQGFSTSAMLVHKNPEIRGELILIKSGDSTQVLARAKISKAIGKAGPHFETGEHIDAAYAQAGEAAGAFILNN